MSQSISNPVLAPEKGATIAKTLARKSGGKKRRGFYDIAEQVAHDVLARQQHIREEQERAARERRMHSRTTISAIHHVAQATFGLVSKEV